MSDRMPATTSDTTSARADPTNKHIFLEERNRLSTFSEQASVYVIYNIFEYIYTYKYIYICIYIYIYWMNNKFNESTVCHQLPK